MFIICVYTRQKTTAKKSMGEPDLLNSKVAQLGNQVVGLPLSCFTFK